MKHLPNIITLSSLFCGLLSIVAVFEHRFDHAVYFVYLALIFDFADGFVARLVRAQSEIGKQLDSLSDIISFGVAPSILNFVYLEQAFGPNPYHYMVFIAVLLSALRLAKFNTLKPLPYFVGLPVPAFALFALCLPFLSEKIQMADYQAITTLTAASFLMVSPLRILSLKKIDRIKSVYYLLCVVQFLILLSFTSPIISLGMLVPLFIACSLLHYYILKNE